MDHVKVVVGALETNCYIIFCSETGRCAIIDPGAEADKIIWEISDKNLTPVLLINTHGHVDHVGANIDIKNRYDVPLLIHEKDAFMLSLVLQSELGLLLGAKESPPADQYLKEGDRLEIGDCRFEVIHTPGHSEGGICLYGEGRLYCGDTLFCGGVGRADLPGGSWDQLLKSIRGKLLTLPGDTEIFPGHGPSSMISHEERSNPFIR